MIQMQEQQDQHPLVLGIIAQFKRDEVETTKTVLQSIQNDSPDSLNLLKALNQQISFKNERSHQRRDVAAIARLVADSNILIKLQHHIREQAGESGNRKVDGFFLQTIKLIGSICWENPHLIDSILDSSPRIMDLLFAQLSDVEVLPAKANQLVHIINFMHSVSLKEGPIRDQHLAGVFTKFFQHLFTNDKFYGCLDTKNLTSIFGAVQKFHSNVKVINKYLYNALIRSIKYVNDAYKAIECQYEQSQKDQGTIAKTMQAIKMNDRKLVALLKIKQKSTSGVFQQMNPFRFMVYLKSIAKIAIDRKFVLVDAVHQNKILVNSISETLKLIKEWKSEFHVELKEAEKKQIEIEDVSSYQVPDQSEQDIQREENFYELTPSVRKTLKQFDKFLNKISYFTIRYLIAIKDILSDITPICNQLASDKAFLESPHQQVSNQTVFRALRLGSRLDRILSIVMKVMDEKQLIATEQYNQMLNQFFPIFSLFFFKGHLSQVKTIRTLLPQLKNLGVESDLSKTRFIYQKIDEDQFKTNLHLRVMALPNSYTLISDTILKFSVYLSDQKEYLDGACFGFITNLLQFYEQKVMDQMGSKSSIEFQDIEMLRSIVKIFSQMFPNNHKCHKDELIKLKLYNYCLSLQQKKPKFNLFRSAAKIINTIEIYNPSAAQEQQDSLKGRHEVAKSIFYKLVTHRLKTFFSTITGFYQDFRKITPFSVLDPYINNIVKEKSYILNTNIAYVEYIQEALKLIIVQNLGIRQSSLKEQVVGSLLTKLYEFRRNELQRDICYNDQETELLYLKEIKLFNQLLEKRCSNMFDWIITKLDHQIYKLPMLIKKLLQFQKFQQLFQGQSAYKHLHMRYVASCFRKISQLINQSYYSIEGQHLDLGIKVAKKKAKTKAKDTEMDMDIEQLDLGKQVIKLANCCTIIAQFMIEYIDSNIANTLTNVISENYIVSLINFSLLYLQKYSVEVHYPQEVNILARSTLWVIENYINYKKVIVEEKERRKKEKQEERKRQRRKRKNAMKNKSNIKKAKASRSLVFNERDIKENKSNDRNQSNVSSNKSNPLLKRRRKGRNEKLGIKQAKINQKNQQKLKESEAKKAKKRATSNFETRVYYYLKTLLQVSNDASKPFLKTVTLQYIIKFITQNLKKNVLSENPFKNFQLKFSDYISDILRLTLKEKKSLGYHLLLSRIGIKLISEEHMKIDYETGIKRFFYDRYGQMIQFTQFLGFLQANFPRPPNLSHLVQIVYKEPGGQQIVALPFTHENIQGVHQTGKKRHCLVRVKQNIELNMITVKKTEKKGNHQKQEQKKDTIKLSGYVPEGQINIFVSQLINKAIYSIILEIDQSMQYLRKKDTNLEEYIPMSDQMEPFNAKTMIHTLHFLIRESPTLAPWIAKFKCKKIILNCLKSPKIINNATLPTYIYSLLNNYGEQHQTIAEIGFLQVLLRLFSPFLLNTVSGIIFQLCLDSTPLVQNCKNGNESDEKKPKFVPFASVVRQKVVSELDSIIFGGEPLQHIFRKAAVINTLSVLMNIKQVVKILIQSNFISKLYNEYVKITNQYARGEEVFLMPSVYLAKIYIPFFFEPISVLQELNIAFHHNKKLMKNQQKTYMNSLLQTEQYINSQLIPGEIFKKNFFKADWPFRKEQKEDKGFRHHERSESGSSSSDSSSDRPEEELDEDLYSDLSIGQYEEESASSDFIQQRMAELDRIHHQEEYVSLSSGNNEHLLSDEWDYSNSNQSQIENQESLLDQELQRQYIQNQLQRQVQESQNESYQDLSEGERQQMQELQQEGMQGIEDGQDQELDQDQASGFLSSFLSVDENEETISDPLQQFGLRFKDEQSFYDNVSDIIAFQKVNVVARISRIEIAQVTFLRFYLQLFSFPERQLENQLSERIKSEPQLYQQKKTKGKLQLLQAFSNDKEISLTHRVQWNQVYRFDQFVKKHPMSERALVKLFTDEHELGVTSRPRRRNAIIHRNGLIQVFPGPHFQHVEESPPNPPQRAVYQFVESSSVSPVSEQIEYSRSHQSAHQNNNRQLQRQNHQQNSPIVIQSQPQDHPESQIIEEDQQQMPENEDNWTPIYRLNQDIHLNTEQINHILRELNMNINPEEFNLFPPETQNDIIQNYYMARNQRGVAQSPINVSRADNPEIIQIVSEQNRNEELDVSPRIGRNPILVHQIEDSNSEQVNRMGGQVQDQYQKMSKQHMLKVGKDIIQNINKNGKNDNKFYQLQDQQLQKILNMFYQLDYNDFRHFPYSLMQAVCINSKNLQKVISTLITLLFVHNIVIEIEEEEYNETKEYFKKLRQKMELVDKQAISKKLPIKILYFFKNITKNYSIAMSFLKVNVSVPERLKGCLEQTQTEKTSLQMLITLLHHIPISAFLESLTAEYILGIVQNITIHHFYKSINALVLKNQEVLEGDGNLNQSIRISHRAAKILCNLLRHEHTQQTMHSLSRIIMRLSINQSNLQHFVSLVYNIVGQLALQSYEQINALCSKSEKQVNYALGIKDYLKLVNLMNVFFDMVISFKSYPSSPEKHEAVLKDLRKIVELKHFQMICEKAAKQLFQSTDPRIQTVLGEILEIYFILYEIALATSKTQKASQPEDLVHKHIAGLGHLKELRKLHKSSQLLKQQDLILGEFNLSKLWKESIGQPAFKSYINNCIKKKLTNFIEQRSNLNQSIFDVPIFKVAISTPHMLSFDNKRIIFKNELKRLKKGSKHLLLHMNISREEVFEDSFTETMHYDSEQIKGKIKIEFKDQQGEDAGGITREWFQLLSKKMFDPNYALFKSGSTGNTFHPSPQSYINSLHLKYFKFIGRIIGKALYDGYLLDAYFTPAFYKHILNLPITYLDMEEEDYDYFKSLKWILDNSPIQSFLELNFTYSFDNFGEIQAKELIPRGNQILVTQENKFEYVQLSSYAKMATSIKHQLQALLEGFHELIPHKLIKIFNEKELEIMISGRPTIDIEDLRRNTDLVNYLKNDQIITWLFEVLQSFDMQLRTAFLQFVTGSSRVPVQGFKDLRGMNGVQKFNIHKEFQQDRLPRAHTCFNQLDLPNYKTKQILIEKLMLAITEGKQGFHML